MNRSYGAQRSAAEKILDADIKERVLRGLEVLKEEYGEEWVSHIDPARLDLANVRFCILGQLEGRKTGGDYNDARDRIEELQGVPSHEFGFDTPGASFSYRDLADAWKLVGGLTGEEA